MCCHMIRFFFNFLRIFSIGMFTINNKFLSFKLISTHLKRIELSLNFYKLAKLSFCFHLMLRKSVQLVGNKNYTRLWYGNKIRTYLHYKKSILKNEYSL